MVTGIHVFPNYIDVPANIREEVKQEQFNWSKTKPYTTYMQNIRSTNTNMVKRNKWVYFFDNKIEVIKTTA